MASYPLVYNGVIFINSIHGFNLKSKKIWAVRNQDVSFMLMI